MCIINLLNVLSGSLTPLIALIAVYIAYQQYLINRKKVNLDLFEKRIKVFNETKQVLFKIERDDKIDIIVLRDYIFSVNDSKFLFGKEISDYIEEIKTRAIDFNHSSDGLEYLSVGSNERIEKVGQRTEMRKWFSNEYNTVEVRFLKYIDFTKI